MKTNAMRLLERANITYELRSYEIDESDLSAELAAQKLGMLPETVFKTLVALGNVTGPLLALIPSNSELDLRSIAKVSGNKLVDMVPLRDLQKLTGYVRGAVTPLATKRPYTVFVDHTVNLWPIVGISAGLRGQEILLAPIDLIRITSARIAEIARTKKQFSPRC